MKRVFSYFLPLVFVGIWSCAPTRFVEPLAKKESAVSANFGGPLIHFSGMVIPIPFSALTYGYGLDSNNTVFASVHTTAMTFGTIQNEWGIDHRFLKQNKWRPALSTNLVANTGIDVWEGNFKFWPQLDINAYWHLKKQNRLVYFGLGNWFELASTKAHGEKQTVHWIPSPHLGYRYTHGKWTYFIEGKMLAPMQSNQRIVVDYVKPWGEHGASGIYLGIQKHF